MSKKKSSQKRSTKRQTRSHKKMGMAPGNVMYLGEREGAESEVDIIEYGVDSFEKLIPDNLDHIASQHKKESTSWINITGISDERFIEDLGAKFGLNTLVLEDAVNTQQRPKIDEYDEYIFGVFKMLYFNEAGALVVEHVALVLLDKSVLVFQETKDDVFNGVRDRIEKQSGRIRTRGADYLFFALLDAIIDQYFVVLEYLNDRIAVLEEEVYNNPTNEVAQSIQELKKEVLRVRKWMFPVKELINRLIDTENTLITKDTKLFLRDLTDHCSEINESLQIYREMSMSLMEMYMSNMSNKMNEVMKVLTIMASIFIPLTFIAGVYGMNFQYMPELQWDYGYYMVWAIMLAMFIGMLFFFKRKKWL